MIIDNLGMPILNDVRYGKLIITFSVIFPINKEIS